MMTDKVKRIISQIINNCQFPRIDKLNSNEKDSFYKKFPFANGHIVEVRVSNHKTDLNTWATRKYGDGFPDIRISIVFQDVDAKNVVLLNNPIKKPISVIEFVYDMRPENSILSDREIGGISKQIMGLPSALSFNDPTHFGISGTLLTSINQTENNQNIKENINMNKKQTIRINENQLRQIVMESVKRILKEEFDFDREHSNNHIDGVEIFAKDAEDAKRIQEYILDNYGVRISLQPGQTCLYVPFDFSNEGSKRMEYDFSLGGRKQYLEALSFMGIKETQVKPILKAVKSF